MLKRFLDWLKAFFSKPATTPVATPAPVPATPVAIEPPKVPVAPSDPLPAPTLPPPTPLPPAPTGGTTADPYGYGPKPTNPATPSPSPSPDNGPAPIDRDPTVAWFGTEFTGPGSVTSRGFGADGKYEVVTGYDVDRGHISASIPGVGVIHNGDYVELHGTYVVVLTATGPGGSSVQLYKR